MSKKTEQKVVKKTKKKEKKKAPIARGQTEVDISMKDRWRELGLVHWS